MGHVAGDKKLRHRVRRLKGQVAAIESTIADGDCRRTLELIAACRGAMTALMVEVLESHVREHILDDTHRRSPERDQAAADVLRVLRSYLK